VTISRWRPAITLAIVMGILPIRFVIA